MSHAITPLLLLAIVLGASRLAAQTLVDGVTTPIVLTPFDPSAPPCTAPPGLERVLFFAQDNDRQFMQGAAAGLAAAARDRGLQFRLATSSNDPNRMIEHAQAALASRVGAVVTAPINAATLAQSVKALIRTGAYVGSIVPPPAITILNAPQYRTGQVLGQIAVEYINTKLNGKARVVLLTHDSNQFLAQRFVAMREELKRVPGAVVVADISPTTVNKQGGYEMMQKILIAHPRIDVVLGADTVVLGALDAARESRRSRPDQFFGGIDGEQEAVAEIRKRREYKATISLASPVFAYAMGQHAADWLEGKSVPQGLEILPTRLTLDNLQQYEADMAAPAKVWTDPSKRAAYLRMFGNICYDTRMYYLNFPWSSENR